MNTTGEARTESVFEYGSRGESDIHTALRTLLRDGTRYDEAEFITAKNELLPLCFEITRIHAIPCTFDPGVPLHYSKAARTVTAWIRWLSDRCETRHLIRMMYDGIPAPQEILYEGERGGRLQMAAMLRRAAPRPGRDRLRSGVNHYIDALSTATESGDGARRIRRQAFANRTWLEMLLNVTPEPDSSGIISLHGIASGATALVQKLCRDAYPGEELALGKLAEIMSRLLLSPDEGLSTANAAERILRMIRDTHFPMVLQSPGTGAIATTDPLPGHLHVSTIERGGFCGREKTFILGFSNELAEIQEMKAMLGRCRGEVIHPEKSVPGLPPLSIAEWWLQACEKSNPENVRTAIQQWYPLHRSGHRTETTDPASLLRLLDVKEPEPWNASAAVNRDLQAETAMNPLLSIPELRHLLTILRVLTDPENPIPVVEFLRGPFCGADDPALLAYKRTGGQFAFNTRAIPDTDERIARGLQFLKDTVRLVRSNPPGTVIASVVERLALHAVIATSPSGWSGVNALNDVLEIVRDWSTSGCSIPDIVEKLEESPLMSAPLVLHDQTAAHGSKSKPQHIESAVIEKGMSVAALVEAAALADAEIRSRFERAARPGEA